MKNILKGLALLAAITSVVWIAVIWRWQAAHHDVGAGDMATYLVALPLVLFGLVIGMRWAVKGALAKQVEAAHASGNAAEAGGPHPAGNGSPRAGDGAGNNAMSGEAKERAYAWPVIGAWVSGPAGDDVAALLEAAKSGKPSPAPDASLRDFDGLPIMCARTEDLDCRPVEKAWGEWLRSRGQSGEVPERSRVARALASLEPLLDRAAAGVDEWAQDVPQDKLASTRVRVLANWPAQWSEPELAWACHWLDRQLLDRAPPSVDSKQWIVQPLPPASGPQAWQHADALLLTLQREQRDDLLLLIACHSDVSQVSVDGLGRERKLFSSSHQPRGHMPGEGAAALLLSRMGPPEEANAKPAMAWLHRPSCLRRDKSIDAPGKTSADIAAQAVADAIKVADLKAGELAGLCSDADRHSARATELFATTIDHVPHLDAIDEMRLLGVAQGHARQTGAMWAVAGAIRQAIDAERPAMALSLADEHWRMAVIARHRLAPAQAAVPAT